MVSTNTTLTMAPPPLNAHPPTFVVNSPRRFILLEGGVQARGAKEAGARGRTALQGKSQ